MKIFNLTALCLTLFALSSISNCSESSSKDEYLARKFRAHHDELLDHVAENILKNITTHERGSELTNIYSYINKVFSSLIEWLNHRRKNNKSSIGTKIAKEYGVQMNFGKSDQSENRPAFIQTGTGSRPEEYKNESKIKQLSSRVDILEARQQHIEDSVLNSKKELFGDELKKKAKNLYLKTRELSLELKMVKMRGEELEEQCKHDINSRKLENERRLNRQKFLKEISKSLMPKEK